MDIIFSKKSKKQLERLNIRFQQKIRFTLRKFKEHQPVDIMKWRGKENEFRIRCGNFRIQLEKINQGFLITNIGRRENFYFIFVV